MSQFFTFIGPFEFLNVFSRTEKSLSFFYLNIKVLGQETYFAVKQ